MKLNLDDEDSFHDASLAQVFLREFISIFILYDLTRVPRWFFRFLRAFQDRIRWLHTL